MRPLTFAWDHISLTWKSRIAATALVLSLLGAIYLVLARILAGRPTLLEFQVLVLLWALGMFSFTPIRATIYRHLIALQTRGSSEHEANFPAQVLNLVHQAIIATDPVGKITFWNPFAETLLGWTATETQGQSFFDLLLAETSRERLPELKMALRAGQAWEGEVLTRSRSGAAIPTLLSYTPVYDEQGLPAGRMAVLVDLRERSGRQAEADARQSLSAALFSTAVYDEMLPLIVNQTASLMLANGAALVRYHPAQNEMLVEMGTGALIHWSGVHWNPQLSRDATRISDLSELRAALPHLFTGLESIAAITLGTPRETRGLLAITRSGEMASEEQRLFSAIAETVTHALNYADLNEWIARQNEHIAALVSMYSMLAGSSDPAEMHALLAQSIFDLLPDIAEVAIDRYDPHLCQIQRAYAGAYGSGQAAPADQPVRLDSPGWRLQSQVIHSCNALICNDMREYLKTQPVEAARPPGDPLPQSALCVPLLNKDKLIGLITVTSYSLQRFSPGDLDMLTHLAGAAALALENARLQELLGTPSINQSRP